MVTQVLAAYLGRPALKRRMLAEMNAHVKADQLVPGLYGSPTMKNFRGCAVGCALDSLNRVTKRKDATHQHSRFPAELGIPVELAYLIDHFFESLPLSDAQTWPTRVLAAIPVGADLSGVVPAVLQWSILDPTYGWMAYAETPQQQETVKRFASAVHRDWSGVRMDDQDWVDLDRDLASVLEWAWARAETGARAGAWARAGARAGAWAWAGARAEWYQAADAEVIRLLTVAPVSPEKGTRRDHA